MTSYALSSHKKQAEAGNPRYRLFGSLTT